MRVKKLLAGCFSALVLTSSATAVFGADMEKPQNIKYCIQNIKKEKKASLGAVTGIVKEITEPEEGVKHLLIQDERGGEARLVITEDTYILDQAVAKVGDKVTGFYDANAPMLLIYPPQYNTMILVVNKEGQNIKADMFDKNLVSSDGMLKLNIREDTEVITTDGKPFKEKLVNKLLLVVYETATKSIPAQTTPSKVVVLCQKENAEDQAASWECCQ